MVETGSRLAESEGETPARPTRRLRRTFYVAMSVFLVLLVVFGFWPSYYGPLVSGAAEAPGILHFHGVIYMGWMFLFVAQAVLAATGRIRAHRSLGNFGVGYGGVVILLGVLVSFVAPVMHVNAGEWTVQEAAAFVPIPLIDMILFGGLFVAAVIYRPQPEIHKRLMLLATVAIVFAAAFRLQAAEIVPMLAAIGLWFVPVIIAMGYDLKTQGRVHPVYWIGIVAMAVSLLRLPFGTTEFWQAIGAPMFEAMTR